MKVLCLWLLLLVCLVLKVYGKIFSRCELATILQRWGMDGHEGYSLEDWICLAYFASHFNTAAMTQNSDGTSEYGIFQLNSRSWCTDHHSSSRNLCSLSCSGMAGEIIAVEEICITGQLLVTCELIVPPTEIITC
ncbi:sperm acrosome membrane-associated protein 3-like isoform X2 [Candoia aspera]|uniref:sperm acrosome membrane-associated protein 3-like isoform X2 n=1 Tax=Candoia aspera TaxID=51853 RepID=UPI002FD7F496